MRKFAWFLTACTFIACASLAQGQQLDINVGGAVVTSSTTTNASAAILRDAEKGGTWISVGADAIPFAHRLGFGFEAAWRYHQASNPYGQQYRPILYDVNGVFQPKFTKRFGGDFMAGIGAQSLRFNGGPIACGASCITFINSTHLAEHLGAGMRYTFWRHFFVRPELHYYHIHNNTNAFTNDNVFRAGASIGYTFTSE